MISGTFKCQNEIILMKTIFIVLFILIIIIASLSIIFLPNLQNISSDPNTAHSIECPDYREIIDGALDNGDSSLCQQIDDDKCKGVCITSVAARINDETLCSQTDDTLRSASCYKIIAIQKKDSSICSLPNEISAKDDCYHDVAVAAGDESVCDSINNKDEMPRLYYCISTAPRNETTPEICAKFTNFEGCIRDVVYMQTQNAASGNNCNKITSSDLAKDICTINSADFWFERKSCHISIPEEERPESCETNPPCDRLITGEGRDFCKSFDDFIGPYPAYLTNIVE